MAKAYKNSLDDVIRLANNESSELCGIIKSGRRVKLNRSQALNVHKLLTIGYLHPALASLLILNRLMV